jgi:hypothetical protein
MSKKSKGWAAIVYGRTYHLDFRLITVPHDFTAQEINWASQHIIATTQQARNLVDSPRWSLFKNDYYLVVGVTCMVKDLIGDPVKDNQGRPLYVFVGYVTQAPQQIQNLPAYSENCLDNFKILYQEIEQVWLVKNYEQDSRDPSRSQYYPINFCNQAIPKGRRSLIASENQELPTLNQELNQQLNQSSQNPDKIYLWQSSTLQNNLLWQASAQSPAAIATCLNIQGKALNNSPFLNQSSTQVEQFQITDRVASQGKYRVLDSTNNADISDASLNTSNTSLSQKISHRAKEDIDLTLQQAAKMANGLRPRFANASQELINNLSDWNQSSDNEPEESEQLDPAVNDPEFGFKTKKPNSREQDWF